MIWPDSSETYNGKMSIYDDSIFIADAAVYLKATQPDLGIDNPYQLNEEQFNAAVDLLKQQAPNVGEYWPGDVAKQIQSFTNGDSVVGTTWPYQYVQLTAAEAAGRRQGDQAEGGHHGLVGHVDDLLEGRESELHVPLDGSHDLAGGAGSGGRGLRRGAGQPEGLRADEEREPLRRLPRGRRGLVEDVYYWTTPVEDCADDDDGTTCKTQEDWKTAWTEIRG